jgi:outer membrane protein OmpA-like peptidoglycan-associated protein
MTARLEEVFTFCLGIVRRLAFDARLSRPIYLVALLAATGCAAPKNVFVLLPDQDGKTGVIEVRTKGGVQVIDQANQSTRVAGADSKPQTPAILSKAEIAAGWGAVLRNTPLPPKIFMFYFQWDTDSLTPESKAQFPAILEEVKNYPAAELSIVGHTDRVGTAAWNSGLSLRRAQSIKALLMNTGLRHDLIEVEFHGEKNPLIPTADGVPEPRNRRVEVTIR